MIFPSTYNCLHENVYSSNEYKIIPIRYEDRFKIMKWRNEQMYHLRQSELLSQEVQDNYFKNTVSSLFEELKPNQILFSFLKNDECIGYGGLVHINWIDKNSEISFIMNTELENKYFSILWSVFLKLIEQVAFRDLKLHKLHTFAFDLRPHIYDIFESVGFKKEAELLEHCYFDNIFKNVIIHSKFNNLYK